MTSSSVNTGGFLGPVGGLVPTYSYHFQTIHGNGGEFLHQVPVAVELHISM